MDLYTDDATIADEAVLWRRIPPQHFIRDENLGIVRPSSAAFEDHPNGSPMSVLLEEIMRANELGPQDALRGHRGFALVGFTAGLARSLQQKIVRDPLPDIPAHGLVVGSKTRATRRELGRRCDWVVPPPDL